MNAKEKELLINLIEKSGKTFKNDNPKKEVSDDQVVAEMKQSVEMVLFVADIFKRKETPEFFKSRIKDLWRRIRIAIAEWVADIACEIHPDC